MISVAIEIAVKSKVDNRSEKRVEIYRFMKGKQYQLQRTYILTKSKRTPEKKRYLDMTIV